MDRPMRFVRLAAAALAVLAAAPGSALTVSVAQIDSSRLLLTQQVEKRFASLQPRHVRRLMFIVTAVTAVSIAAFGWVPALWMAVVLFLVIYSLGEVSDPLLLAWMNQRLDPDVRATVLSMVGQAESIGQAGGGLLVGLLASLFQVPLALLSIAALLLPALVWIRRADRDPARVAQNENSLP